MCVQPLELEWNILPFVVAQGRSEKWVDGCSEASMDKEGLGWHPELEPSACPKSLQSKKGSCKCLFLMDLMPKRHCLAFGLPEWPI